MEITKGAVCVRTKSAIMPKNIEMIGMDLEGRVLLKFDNELIDGTNEINYVDYIPSSKIFIQLYYEIINKSYLWNIKYEIKPHISRRLNDFLFDIIFIVTINLELINDYINSSLAFNYIIIDKFSELSFFEDNDLSDKSIIPFNTLNITLPNTFKLTLYDYQKKSLAKMIELENREIQKIQYSYNMLFHNIKIIFDPFTNTKIDKELYFNVKTKGGILSDEMGLGKTITSIALILSQPAPSNLPNINNNNKINSKATVIICPSHLAKQWENEIKRCSNLKIITVLTKTEYNHYKFKDFIEADIIITSHQFIMNLKFYQALYYKQCTAIQYNASERYMLIQQFLITNLCDLSFEEIKNLYQPLFEFYNFHRIILDEGHEIFAGLLSNITLAKCISNWISSLDCNNYWYISGTPFINYNGVKNAANFIKLMLEDSDRNFKFTYNVEYNNYLNKNIENFIHKEYLWNNILNKICIRHRKCDIENQINIPGYEEKIIWLNFTDIEKQLYDAKKSNSHYLYLQQLCCHPLIVETSKKIFGDVDVDLSLMQDKLIEYHKKNYIIYKQKLEKLIIGRPEYYMLKKNFETQMNESHNLYTILEKMKNPDEIAKIEDEICCICMEDIKLPAMTKCGHILCSYCLKEWLKHKSICPMCKTNLQSKEIFAIKKNNIEVNPLISKYGSKLGKLISYIKSLIEIDNSKIIVFSQWDDMLSLIGKTLLENNINNSFVKGNLWKRNSAINKFTSSTENKVIMLSLKNAASGTNLTNATHIFFVEPINSSKEEIKSIESQAIARACRIGQKEKVLIIRILIKDTIEEEIYNKNYI